MLLIIFLALIAKLALVCSDCDVGILKQNDFDWTKISGPRPWYVLWHSFNDIENNIDCLKVTCVRPEGNFSLTIMEAYVISEKRHLKNYGYTTNWNNTGYVEVHHTVPTWRGQAYFTAVDYDRYAIMKFCSLDSNKLSFYVGFRSKHPDEATVTDVLKELQANNIDVSQLAVSRTDHCQNEECSTAGGISA